MNVREQMIKKTAMESGRASRFVLVFAPVPSGITSERGKGTRPDFRVLIVLSWLLAACANPVAPSGGPADQTPPAVVEISPPANAVNVSPENIRIRFSEYVNPGSFSQAFSIMPQPEGRIEIDWSGRSATIRLPESLRPNTTYVLTIDTRLRDARGVALKEPLTYAFSTGSAINRGRLSGRVVGARQGEPVAGIDVFAYALGDSSVLRVLPDRPDYRTQTGPDGRFQFEYLFEQPYFVVALEDRNRNRLPDPLEPFAVPSAPSVLADSTDADHEVRWIAGVLDTIPPELTRVRVLSSRRVELRFSEPVRVREGKESWQLSDSLSQSSPEIQSVYSLPERPDFLFVLSDSLREGVYRLQPAGIVDTSDNALSEQPIRFEVAAAPDTVRLRFLGFTPEGPVETGNAFPLLPGELPGIRFNTPVRKDLLSQSVAVTDASGNDRPFEVEEAENSSYHIIPDSLFAENDSLEIRVDASRLAGVDTVYTRLFRKMAESELGELSGVIALPDTTGVVIVELRPALDEVRLEPRIVEADSTGHFIFRQLPEGFYNLRAFLDQNANEKWDLGTVAPYRAAEPMVWSSDSTRVTPRWETVLEDTLRMPGYF